MSLVKGPIFVLLDDGGATGSLLSLACRLGLIWPGSQVAHSKQIVGAGIVAGGPFGCAESQANSFLLSRMNVRSCHLKISSST